MDKLKIVTSNIPEDSLVFVPNSTIDDPRLSLEALGALTRALDKPAGWDLTEKAICVEFGVDESTASRIIRELEDSGYLYREILLNEDGTWSTNAVLYEASQLPLEPFTLH